MRIDGAAASRVYFAPFRVSAGRTAGWIRILQRRTKLVQGHETHLSTQSPQTCPYAWFPCPHGYPWRTQGAQRASCQGSRPPDSLSRRQRPGTSAIARQGFPRSARLLRSADYSRVFEQRQRSSDHYFTVLRYRHGGPGSRLGLAISRKQVKRAVDRNRLKRLIRELFRRHHHRLAGYDLVVMARSSAVSADNRRLNAALLRLMLPGVSVTGPDDPSQ